MSANDQEYFGWHWDFEGHLVDYPLHDLDPGGLLRVLFAQSVNAVRRGAEVFGCLLALAVLIPAIFILCAIDWFWEV